MASAAPSPLASSVEKTNGAKLIRLLIDGGTTVLRSIFNRHHPPVSLSASFNTNHLTLDNLLRRRILRRPQWDLLFPPSGAPPDSQTFDITLLFLLLTNICGLSPPHSSWHTKPPSSDTSLQANLARIKFYRNELYGHVTTTGIADPTFSTLWQEISTVLVALGLQQPEIDRLKAEHCGEKEYIDALLEWADTEEDIKSQLKDMRDIQAKVLQTVEGLKGERESFRRHEILTKLAKVNTSSDVSRHAGKYVEGTRLAVFAEVERWLEDKSSPNRVIVISGNAGMGKSVISAVLCQKMSKAGRLSGSHFCQHNKARRRNPKVMLQSLACQLADSLPEYEEVLMRKLSRNLGVEINDMEVEELFELLFGEPLSDLEDPGSIHLMVIDGLDESEYQGRNELLNVIAKYFNTLPRWIRFVLTTRPEMNISEKLQELNPIQLKPDDRENLLDIRLCFQENLEDVLQSDCQETILEKLVEESEGVMLYTYYLTEFIKKNAPRMSAAEVINSGLPSGISSVYQDYFKRLKIELQKEVGITEVQYFDFLNAIVAAREPLPVDFACKLFLSNEWSSVDEQKVRDAMDCISALLPIEGKCINFFHKSVKDWLIEKSASREKKFTVSERECHRVIAKLCTAELDNLKLKRIQSSRLKQTTRYALQYGVQHILEAQENARPFSLDEIVKNYVLDLELVYAKLSVNSTTATEDILYVQEKEDQNALSKNYRRDLKTVLLLLRKHLSTLSQLPHAIFQTLLNEGGPELSANALSLLNTKYADLPYIEYMRKKQQEEFLLMRFRASNKVACFDISPDLNYLACECRDDTIHLWSLRTAQLLWRHAVLVPKIYEWIRNYEDYITLDFEAFRGEEFSYFLSLYRSVVFHPTLNLILPGILSQAYTISGDLKPLFSTSECSFRICSISQDKTTMLTDSLTSRKCIIQWSLKDGTEITRFTHERCILSFAWSPNGRWIAISDEGCHVCLCDAIDGFKILAQVDTPEKCGMLKLTPDAHFIFVSYLVSDEFPFVTWFFTSLCLERNKDTDGMSYSCENFDEALRHFQEFESCNESGFLLGDPFWYPYETCSCSRGSAFALVLNKQFVLMTCPCSNEIEMFSLDDMREQRDECVIETKQQGIELDDEPGGLAEQRIESDGLLKQSTERDELTEQGTEPNALKEQKCEPSDQTELKTESDDQTEPETKPIDVLDWKAKPEWLPEQRTEYEESLKDSADCDDPTKQRTNPDPILKQRIDALLSQKTEVDFALEQGRALYWPAEPTSSSEFDDPYDLEYHGALLEHLEDIDSLSFNTLTEVVFSVDGETLYVVMSEAIQQVNLMTGEVSAKKFTEWCSDDRLVLPVKRGILFKTRLNSLELWNSDLSTCVQNWTDFRVRNVLPTSEDRVALEVLNIDTMKEELVILDATSGHVVSTIRNWDGKLLACTSKYEVLTKSESNSLQLRREDMVLWDHPIPSDVRYFFKPVIFSPSDQYFVVYGDHGVYAFDTFSGNSLWNLKVGKIDHLKFISNEDCLVSFKDKVSAICLRLYNVKSGDVLSEIVEELPVCCLAAFPRKQLVAIGFEDCEDDFEILHVKLPRGKREKSSIRLKLPPR